MSQRFFCVHGHFYQPPREDPLSGVIPDEIGATPFPNWNERIHAECYRPNAELQNFERISFNIGPTLAAWMQNYDPLTFQKIVVQDQVNVRRFGVGNAIAQAYNHTILPLASHRDKVTQVAWGTEDFRFRFGRAPQGMWLPETAVDLDALQVMADQGIQFTILAPWQADTDDLDTSQPYWVNLPNGKKMIVFFYNQELSGRISFDAGATINADHFVQYILLSHYLADKERRGEPQLILVASDGELYGHHQYLRDRFLARLVDGASNPLELHPTFPALWLRDYLPRQTIKIREYTSWSCHHGVTRWMGVCACTPGNANWKAQLRFAFEHLAGEVDGLFQEVTKPYVSDAWELRNRYIDVILGKVSAEELISSFATSTLTSDRMRRIHLMLEAQRERQRMFTSCGWFFDDFDRIEPKNNVAYAAQAVRLTYLATGIDLETELAADLHRVYSQRSRLRADKIFSRHLRRAESVTSARIGYAD
jgi:hypothetical protein